MERRALLAITLSLLVLVAWSTFVSKTQPIENKWVTQKIPEPISSPNQPLTKQTSDAVSPAAPLVFSKDYLEVNFDSASASIQDAVFHNYQDHRFKLYQGFFFGDKNWKFKKESVGLDKVSFTYQDANKQISKDFIFSNSSYSLELRIKIKNLSTNPLLTNFPLVLGSLKLNGGPATVQFQDLAVATPEKVLHLNARKDAFYAETKFLGLRDRYFCAIVEPVNEVHEGFIKKISRDESEAGLKLKEKILNSGESAEYNYRIYLGPQDLKLIKQADPAWTAVLHYGIFDFISHILLQVLELAHKIVRNWGWAIIILSVLIYLILYPLTLKQMRSMKEMQVLQPKIQELQKAHKDNPQKLNREIMGLYREHKVNPLGGCLPLLLQMPIFFALYQVLSRAVALKGARFLWIKDLSSPDRLFTLPTALPIIGNEINILPILMMIGMFLQQKKSTMQTATKEQAEQQKIMLILFPLMFGFIFYHMPSGLVLYWFTNSVLTLIYQFKVTH